MKPIFKTLLLTTFIFIATTLLQAQTPPHPNGGNAPSGSNAPVGGNGAPIGNGTFLLIGLAGLYAGKKWHINQQASEIG
jgi:hypothetical protein